MTVLSRLRDALTGRDPADVLAEATYRAMCTPPPYATLALALEAATDQAARAALLATVDDATRAHAVAYVAEPKGTRERVRRLTWARADGAKRFPALLTYYRSHIPAFISEWMTTHDPRLKEKTFPFVLFPRQVEMVEAMLESYHNGAPLSIVKSRDSGASWVAMALLVSLAIFEPGFTAIVGSQLEVKIDQSGTSGTLFHKIRSALESLPEEFRGGWTLKTGSANMRVYWPNGSAIQGEAGEAIGRGGRASVICLDEYAHLAHPDLVDAAVMATAESKWYISSVNGTDNPFAKRVREGKTPVFTYTWRDDPRKTEEWAAKKIAADGQRKFDQEYGCDFNAGNVDQMFPAAHISAAVDAHIKLGLEPTGRRYGALDVGAGTDPSAFCIVHGNVVIHLETWPSTTNLVTEVRRAFAIADRFALNQFAADSVGVGSGIEGIAAEINRERTAVDPDMHRAKRTPIYVHSFKSSESPLLPERPCFPGSAVNAEDYYPNRKSQGYDSLRYRLALTYQALAGDRSGKRVATDYISISSSIPPDARNQLLLEMAQIRCEESPGGKLQVDKYGTDGESPNACDALMMATAPRIVPVRMTEEFLAKLA